MNLSETADLLSAMSAFDRRTIGEGDVIAWQAVLSDASFRDCLEAVKQYYAEHTEWMMPAHVRRLVRDMVRAREAAARATGWAPGQAGVPKDEAMPISLRPSDAGARLALSDLPAAVADLVARVRADLPEGSRGALAPRTVAWEREHRAFLRTRDGAPNPLYRPSTLADVDGEAFSGSTCPGCFEQLTGHGFHASTGKTRCGAPQGEAIDVETVECPLCSALSQDLPRHIADYHPERLPTSA